MSVGRDRNTAGNSCCSASHVVALVPDRCAVVIDDVPSLVPSRPRPNLNMQPEPHVQPCCITDDRLPTHRRRPSSRAYRVSRATGTPAGRAAACCAAPPTRFDDRSGAWKADAPHRRGWRFGPGKVDVRVAVGDGPSVSHIDSVRTNYRPCIILCHPRETHLALNVDLA